MKNDFEVHTSNYEITYISEQLGFDITTLSTAQMAQVLFYMQKGDYENAQRVFTNRTLFVEGDTQEFEPIDYNDLEG